MRTEIVHDHDIAGSQRWDQKLFNPGKKALRVDRTIENTGSVNPVRPESGKESHCPPMTMRNLRGQAFAYPTTTMRAGHIRLRPRLVNKNEPSYIEPTLISLPSQTLTRDISPVLLGGQETFF
jgi:hypothetical protein